MILKSDVLRITYCVLRKLSVDTQYAIRNIDDVNVKLSVSRFLYL